MAERTVTNVKYRTTARGLVIQSNYEAEKITDRHWRCSGCGRNFRADTPGQSDRIVEARTQRHADVCRGARQL